mmetsp:Transcript_10196/g.41517  ORF Transcript_10196/g.41517 Transcript_10196/m.41517 type:complete len:622 (+) Transcript_10196:175-2040(+)
MERVLDTYERLLLLLDKGDVEGAKQVLQDELTGLRIETRAARASTVARPLEAPMAARGTAVKQRQSVSNLSSPTPAPAKAQTANERERIGGGGEGTPPPVPQSPADKRLSRTGRAVLKKPSAPSPSLPARKSSPLAASAPAASDRPRVAPKRVASAAPCLRNEKQQRLYDHVAEELVSTELRYVTDLQFLVEQIKKPLEEKGLVTPAQSATLFSNLPMIWSVNTELYRKLQFGKKSKESSAAKPLSQEEVDIREGITAVVRVTVMENDGSVKRTLPISGMTTFADAYRALLKKLDPKGESGAKYDSFQMVKDAEALQVYPPMARIMDSCGYFSESGQQQELDFIFRREVNKTMSFGQAMLSMAAYLKAYSVYCSNQMEALELIVRLEKEQPEFKQFIRQAMKDPKARNLDMNSFLIMPLQRICKYPLLLREMLAATPAQHPEHAELQKASALIGATVMAINNAKREREGQKFMRELVASLDDAGGFDLITPSRKFLSQGMTQCFVGDETVKAVFFLFNDLLLITSRKEEGRHRYIADIPLDNAVLSRGEVEHSFCLVHPQTGAITTLVGRTQREFKKAVKAVQEQLLRVTYDAWVSSSSASTSYQEWYDSFGATLVAYSEL